MVRDEALRPLVASVAISIPQDNAAFAMLHRDFISQFERYYAEKERQAWSKGERLSSSVLDELIIFAIMKLPEEEKVTSQSLASLKDERRRAEIIERFMKYDIPQLLTILARRDSVRESIRRFLHASDKRNTHSIINTTKLEPVFVNFFEMFQNSYAAAFAFDGKFISHVMHCFVDFYYPGHTKDIWRIINSVDFARREAEQNITGVSLLTPKRTDDLYIRHMAINIKEVNDRMFSHSGQSEDARGISYDIFYMIILHLCSGKIEKLNAALKPYEFKVQLIDERDRRKFRNGLPKNNGIANKISNAKMLIPALFDCIRSGEWNLENLTEIRDICFSLGKKDRDGKNCVWQDVQGKAETSRYFDRSETPKNYKAFDQILKGTLSVYSLMKALEERGMYIVDTYNRCPGLFEDRDLPRSVDFLSSLGYIDEMIALQREAESYTGSSLGQAHGELMDFDGMVWKYVGSAENNQAEIRSNRYLAYSRGLLDNPRLKQSGSFQSEFEKLQSAADYLTAIPRGFEEYALSLLESRKLPAHYAPEAVLNTPDVEAGKYKCLYYNKFFAVDKDIASYYLYHVATGDIQINSFAWSIGNSLYPCLEYVGSLHPGDPGSMDRFCCLYVSMVDTFLCCSTDDRTSDVSRLPCVSLEQLKSLTREQIYNGQRNALLQMAYRDIPRNMFNPFIKANSSLEDEREDALQQSLGFDSFLGIENYATLNVQKRLDRIELYPKYKTSVERYVQWMADISWIQNSFIDILQTMMTYSLFLARGSGGSATGYDESQGAILIDSLLKSEFKEDNLAWFFQSLDTAMSRTQLYKVDMRWGTIPSSMVEFTELDLRCLDILYGRMKNSYSKGTFMHTLLQSLRDYETPAQRFVQLYNYLNTKLSFIRVLRDAYDLVFNVVIGTFSTLGCELNSRFGIENVFDNARDASGQHDLLEFKYALLDSLSIDEVTRFVSLARQDNWMNFQVLCDDLLAYLKRCRQDISDLIDYDIVSSSPMQSKFMAWGSTFYMLPLYTEPFVQDAISDLKARLRTDDAGFIMCRGSYFKGCSGNSDYYLHVSGRMVAIGPDHSGPVSFNFKKEEDRRLYEEIVKDGKRRSGW